MVGLDRLAADGTALSGRDEPRRTRVGPGG